MNHSKLLILSVTAIPLLLTGVARAADIDTMLEACRDHAAKTLRVQANVVRVKYEGQRVDRSHAVNGSAVTQGLERTFQCSFNSAGKRIGWVLNPPESGVASAGSSAEAGPSAPVAPEDGGPRNWWVSRQLNLREEPSTSARIISGYAPGTILDNLGCLRAEGRAWCDVQQLGGGPRGYVAADFLKPAVSPDGSVAIGPDDSALRAGRGEFDATGNIPCARFTGQPMGTCEFGVARAGGGYATVVVKKPDGRTRAIFFRMGKPIGADTSQADGYGEFSARREGDLNLIRVGDERYEIPDAVILGG